MSEICADVDQIWHRYPPVLSFEAVKLKRRFYLLPVFVAAGFWFCGMPCAAQEGGDLQAQILYAFQTEDVNQLRDIIQGLTAEVRAGGAAAAVRYHLAHADYRIAKIESGLNRREAEAALQDCVGQLQAIVDVDENSAESLALQAACYNDLAGYRKLQAPLLRVRANARIGAALKIAPHNPRVVLIAAAIQLSRAKPAGAEHDRAAGKLREAASLFEHSPATRADLPGWGHAEAYLAMGEESRASGDVLAARNWIEKALIVAPDFKAAQRLQAMPQR